MPPPADAPEAAPRRLGFDLGPARCPDCGERQNVAVGEFDPKREPFGPVHCMVCGHLFTRNEFRAGLAASGLKHPI